MVKKGKSTENSNTTEQSNENQSLQVPDLDQLITQITNNGDFKEMMSSISGGLTPEHEQILENTDLESDSGSNHTSDEALNDTTPEKDIVNESQYDMMCSLFTDNDGNNLCEILNTINQNLTQLNQNIKKHNDLTHK